MKKEPSSEWTGPTQWDLQLVDCQCLPIPLGLDEGCAILGEIMM